MPALTILAARLPAALDLLLVALLATQTARLVWIALTPIGPLGPSPAAATADPIREFPALDLFYPAPVSQGVGGAHATLGYQLFGLRGGNGGPGSAILAATDGRQASYLVGESVIPGITLEAIGSDFAVLSAGGARHRLALAAPSDAPTPASPVLAMSPPLPTSGSASAAVDPIALLAQTSLLARSEAGRITGYTVVARGDGALLGQAGLQAGDVLLSVNGQTLTPERLGELREELKGKQQAVITFERDGQARSITVQAPQP